MHGTHVLTAKRMIRDHEGLMLKPYTDTTGHLTIGYGRNLADRGITIAEAEYMLETDMHIAMVDAESLAGTTWLRLSPTRRAVLIDMAFNLGRWGLSEFKRFWAALERGDFDSAAKEMINSRWAFQVGERALTLAEKMRHG